MPKRRDEGSGAAPHAAPQQTQEETRAAAAGAEPSSGSDGKEPRRARGPRRPSDDAGLGRRAPRPRAASRCSSTTTTWTCPTSSSRAAVYCFRDRRTAPSTLAFTDRHGGVSRVAVRRAQPGGLGRRRRPTASRPEPPAAAGRLRPGRRCSRPCTRCTAPTSRRRARVAGRPRRRRATRWSPTARRGAAGPGRRLRAGAARRRRRRGGRRRPRRSPRRGGRRRPGDGRPGCASSVPAGSTAWIGPHVCGGCYEVPGEMRAEVAAVVPGACADDLVGHARRSTSAPASAPSSTRRGRRGASTSSRCTRESADLYSYRRDGDAAGRLGRPWSGSTATA